MTDILYYSNFCNHSKKVIQILSKTDLNKKFHFICIDNRIREENKTYIILPSGQKIIMPDNISRVPAILKLSDYSIIYGDDIYTYIKPQNDNITKQETRNNLEPFAFSFGSGSVTSDNFSFLDMEPDSLTAKGDGGLRQMYNYASVDYNNQIYTPTEEFEYKKTDNSLSIEQLEQKRKGDLL